MSRLVLDLTGRLGGPVEVEIVIRRDTVELWCHQHCCSVLDRDQLRSWLRTPRGLLDVDEATWLATGNSGVALAIHHLVTPWSLHPEVLQQLRTHLDQD